MAYGSWTHLSYGRKTQVSWSSTTPPKTTTTWEGALVIQEQRSGSQTAAYKTRLSYRLPVNGFSYRKTYDLKPFGSYTTTNSTGTSGNSYTGVLFPHIDSWGGVSWTGSTGYGLWRDIPQATKDSLDATARTKVLNKLKAQKVNLAQVVAERERTVQLVAGNFLKLAQAFRALKRGDLRKARNALGIAHTSVRAGRRFRKVVKRDQSAAVSRRWLELQYGWKPLLQDIYGSIEALAAMKHDPVKGRVTAVSSYNRETRVIYRPTSTDSTQYEYDILRKQRCDVKYVLYFELDLKTSHTLSSLGLTNPAALAWEMLPFSFVLDWALPIGDWLSSWDATFGLKFVDGSKTVFSDCSADVKRNVVKTGGTVVYKDYDVSTSYGVVSCSRGKLSTFPIPGLPQWKNPASLMHMSNAAALLRLAFRSAKPTLKDLN